MKAILKILLFLLTVVLLSQCEKDEDFSGDSGTFKDSRDGQTYKWVRIGRQIWMAENFNYEADSGSWVYNDDISYGETYGRLYDWKTALDACPDGWHLPTYDEWTVLIDYLGGGTAGGKMKTTGTTFWDPPNTGATNSSGFSALPGGLRCNGGCTYFGMGLWATFWSSIEIDSVYAERVTIYNSADYIEWTGGDKNVAKSVRCIKD